MMKIKSDNIETIVALTPMQEGMLFHFLKDSESNYYFEQLSLSVLGELDKEMFKRAWNFVVETNEMLRTIFRWEKVENPVQIVIKEHKLKPVYYDLSDYDENLREKKLKEVKAKDKAQKFDLGVVSFRVTLCKLQNTNHVMIISNHHILYDGWSNGIILNEFLEVYDALLREKEINRPVKTKFKEFVKWIRSQNTIGYNSYWNKYFQNFTPTGEIYNKFNNKKRYNNTRNYKFVFPVEMADQMDKFLKSQKITFSALVYSAWGILLQKYNNTEDIIFDVTASGRSAKIKGIENVVGLFINTMPLRIKTHTKQKIREMLITTNGMLQEREQSAAILPGNIENPQPVDSVLFYPVLVIENYPLEGLLRQGGEHELTLTSFSIDEITRYDLTAVITTFSTITLDLTYYGDFFDEESIKKFAGYFFRIIEEIIVYPDKAFWEMDISLQEERERILSILNSRIPLADESVLSLTGSEKERCGDIEDKLKEIWAEVFHVDKKNINIDSSFFDFGRHSLKAAALTSTIHKHLNVKMPFGQIFKSPTIKEQAKYIRELKKTLYIPIKPAEEKEYYILSPSQQRIFILQQIEENIIHYNGIETFVLLGKVDLERLENTFKKIVARHESLRTSFKLLNGIPVQIVHKEIKFEINFIESKEERVMSVIRNFFKPFQPESVPLFRIKLIQVEEQKFVLIVDMHHLISDGVSIQVLINDFKRLYDHPDNQGMSLQYKDYIAWLSAGVQKEKLDIQEKYWLHAYSGELSQLNLYTDYPRPLVQDYSGDCEIYNFDNNTLQRLRKFASRSGTTIYQVLFSAFNVLLWKLSGQEDIILGTPTAGRSFSGLDKIVGMFVNTLAIRSYPTPEKSFRQYLNEVKDILFNAYENQDYPFETLVERLGLQGERSRNPLFNVWVNSPYLGELGKSEILLQDIKIVPHKFDYHVTAFDLSLFIREYTKSIELKLEYKTSLFKRFTIEYFLKEYVLLVEEILSSPDNKLEEFNIFSRKRIPIVRNSIVPVNEYQIFEAEEMNQSIARRFEKQVEKYPNHVAVMSAEGDHILSYSALNKYANKVAREICECFDENSLEESIASLTDKTTQGRQTVALLFGHDIDMPAGILGTLKSGRIYAPLDPTYPENRLIYLLEDSEAKLILTNSQHLSLAVRLQEKIGQHVKVIEVNTIDDEGAEKNLEISVDPDQIAYILYTSGSTGNPKGVMQSHRNVLHFMQVFANNCHINSSDRVFLFANYCFDASVIEMFSALLNGAALHLYSVKFDDVKEGLTQWLMDREITIIHTTPTFYRHLIGSLKQEEKFSTVRIIMMGGESLYKRDVELYRQYFAEHCIFVNNFGMTEASTNLEFFIDKTTPLPHNFVPMGFPVEETEAYILNEDNKETAAFEVGELVIKSDYLARGYWKQPEKTRQVFPPCPLTNQGRVYRTGDLVRLHPDGNIEYLGRKDFQVKLRGFRIELGEIENQLLTHKNIKKAVVIDRTEPSGKKYLCGYIIADVPLSSLELKSFLSENLPDYLIPTYFFQLDQFPLTPTGKINRKFLPVPENPRQEVDATFMAPTSNIDKMIADIWKEILHLEKIGLNDNFFELGGTSLDIIRLQGKLKESFQKEISLGTILGNPTIRFMGEYFKPEAQAENVSVNTKKDEGKPGIQHISKINRHKKETETRIAVVGMEGRFPGANNLIEYWENLKVGRETISFFTDDELIVEGIDAAVLQEPEYIKAKGITGDMDFFDASFFDYSAREASVTDPQLRVLHECAWEALENAGYNPHSYNGIIGFYIGAGTNLYWMSRFFSRQGDLSPADRFAIFNLNSTNSYSTRVAYKLNLKGPILSIQTACSTSLVSIHLACQGLLNGECDMALAGGVSLSLPNKNGYFHQEGMINSSDGHCRAFDAAANGTVFGDGMGIVVLKPLKTAILDGDNIRAVIKGSAINNDGSRKVGYTAPGIEGQSRVIREAINAAGIEAESISYLETHGTGTAMGDPHEIEALTQAFATQKTNFCKIGSVKTNVGHLDAAAGVAGFIKTVLALEYKLIPPSLHFVSPNPEIDFEKSPFSVNTTLTKWERGQYPLRAGVSSFGIGGTNAHVILEEYPGITSTLTHSPGQDVLGESVEIKNEEVNRPYQLILFSAKSETALEKMSENLVNHFKKEKEINLADAAFTLQVGRRAFIYRKFLAPANVKEAIAILGDKNSEKLYSFFGDEVVEGTPSIVFMFPGQGAQYINMGLELYQTEAVFREEMEHCFEIVNPLLSCDIREILYPSLTVDSAVNQKKQKTCSNSQLPVDINQTEIAQPLLFIFEYALAKLLMKWGIMPYAMIGHSIGEYTAACLAGVFSLEDAISLVVARGRLMQQNPKGAMLGVPLSEEELTPLLSDELSLAAVNSPSDCVVSGPLPAIEAFERQMEKRGINTSHLHTSHAFHSKMMDPVLNEFGERVKTILLNKPRIPFISNRTGNWITIEEAVDPWYWARHIRDTVKFADGLKKLFAEDQTMYIEVGPGRVLSTFARKSSASNSNRIITNLIKHPKENVGDSKFLLEKIGHLWLYGAIIDWTGFYEGQKRKRITLPTYPFERQRYWTEDTSDTGFGKKGIQKLSISKKKNIEDWCYIPTWKRSVLHFNSSELNSSPSTWLVFINENGLADLVVSRLLSLGYEVSTVKSGINFGKDNDGSYTINPQKPGDYDLLLNDLFSAGKIPEEIIHMWNITGNSQFQDRIETVNNIQQLGFLSLVYLAKALGKQEYDGEYRISAITDNMQEVGGEGWLCPGKATLLGPLNVIPHEYAAIKCRSIDIILPEYGSWQEKKLGHLLLNEIRTNISEPVIAYRGNHRLVQNFESVSLAKLEANISRIKNKGVYLITGGLGGIGLTLGRYLAQKVQAKLILVGRTMLPDRQEWDEWLANHEEDNDVSRKLHSLIELETLGSEIFCPAADVTDFEKMGEVIDAAKKKFGLINGVIHAAGLPGGGLIQNQTWDTVKPLLAAKIEGTLILDRLLRDETLDFFVLCSSRRSITAILGQVAYSAANNFLDAFAYDKASRDGTFCVSINWGSWAEVGMAHRNEFNLSMGDIPDTILQEEDRIFPSEAVKIFDYILNSDLTQVVVSSKDFQALIEFNRSFGSSRLLQLLEKIQLERTQVIHSRPKLSSAFISPANQTEEILTDLWKDFFGFDRIGSHDNFFELGATSLDLVQLSSRLKDKFGREIPVEKMFTYPTIKSLANYLEQGTANETVGKIQMKRKDVLMKGKNLLKQRKKSVKKS